jgi:hypothetical protein
MASLSLTRTPMLLNGPCMNERQTRIFDRLVDLDPHAVAALLEAMPIVGLPCRVSQMTSAQCAWLEGWIDGAERIWESRAVGRKERLRCMLQAATSQMKKITGTTPQQQGREQGLRLALDILWEADEPKQWSAPALHALALEVEEALTQEELRHRAMLTAVKEVLSQFREAI